MCAYMHVEINIKNLPYILYLIINAGFETGTLTEPRAHAFGYTAQVTSPQDLPIPAFLVCVAVPDIFTMGFSH